MSCTKFGFSLLELSSVMVPSQRRGPCISIDDCEQSSCTLLCSVSLILTSISLGPYTLPAPRDDRRRVDSVVFIAELIYSDRLMFFKLRYRSQIVSLTHALCGRLYTMIFLFRTLCSSPAAAL